VAIHCIHTHAFVASHLGTLDAQRGGHGAHDDGAEPEDGVLVDGSKDGTDFFIMLFTQASPGA